MKTPWTPADETKLTALRAEGKSAAEIARALGRGIDSVNWKSRKLGLSASVPAKKAAVTDEAAFWKREAEAVRRALSESSHQRVATDILVESAKELAPVGYQPVNTIVRPAKRNASSPQSAVLIFSDTHIGQVVKPEQTLGMGLYNFEIFLRRLKRLEQSIFSILQDHTTTKVPEIVIAQLGDMIDGNLSHGVEAGQVNTLFSQFYNAGHAIAQFYRNLSAIAPLRIYAQPGNHPRWGTQKKMPTDNRYSNLDTFLAAYVEALLKDCPRIKIHFDEQPFSRFQVQGWNFLAFHGDVLRGGDKALGVPNHAIGRSISVHAQLAARRGEALPNYVLVGHGHRSITLPHTMGEFLMNGAFPGTTGYALAEAFNTSNPSQRFFLMHPKHGRSASYDLRLDLGDKTPHGYSLPNAFPCR